MANSGTWPNLLQQQARFDTLVQRYNENDRTRHSICTPRQPLSAVGAAQLEYPAHD